MGIGDRLRSRDLGIRGRSPGWPNLPAPTAVEEGVREPRYHEHRTPGVTLGLFQATPSLRLPVHGHERTHACVVLAGTFRERDGQRDRRLEPGSVRLSPAGDEHRIQFGREGGRCLLLMLDSAGPAENEESVRARVFGQLGHLRADAVELARSLERCEPAGGLLAESFATELLARVTDQRAPGAPPDWLLRVRDRMREAPATVDRLGDLASEAGVHPGHLVRSFRAHFGCTPGAFLRLWRVEHARRDVAGTARPLAGIAFTSGFADQAHMTREFRRRLGVTPAALRRQLPT